MRRKNALAPGERLSREHSTLKRQLPKANLRKILAIKFFRITRQIHKGYASLLVNPFSSRLRGSAALRSAESFRLKNM